VADSRSRRDASWLSLVGTGIGFLHAPRKKQRDTLGMALLENNPFDGTQRMEFLRFLAAGLLGSTEIAGFSGDRFVREADGLKRRLQRWGLQFCDESVLQLAWRGREPEESLRS